MRVLLVSSYELGHQPFVLARALGAFAGSGHEVRAIDSAAEPMDDELVRSAGLMALSVPMHTALRLGATMGRRFRALAPAAHLAFFGLYAELNAEALVEAGAHSVLGEGAEGQLVALADALESGATPHLRPAPGPLRTPELRPIRDGLLPLERYARALIDGEERLAGYVEASRGCLHHCRHCPIPPAYAGRFFVTPVETVLDDVAALVAEGARHITFGDPDFLNGPRHAEALVHGLHARFPAVTFDVTAKIEHLLRHRDLLALFAEKGCLFIVSAVESLSDVVLAHLDKGHTRADVFTAVNLCREVGTALRPSLVAFTPWTTLEDYLDVLDWVERDALWDHVDPVQYTVRLLVPPGSLLLSSPAMATHLGPLDPAAFTYPWTHPDPRMDALYAQARAIVEDAVSRGDSADTTVSALRRAACRLLGRERLRPPARASKRPHVPRLSEPWFCCAEPTENQLAQLEPRSETKV